MSTAFEMSLAEFDDLGEFEEAPAAAAPEPDADGEEGPAEGRARALIQGWRPLDQLPANFDRTRWVDWPEFLARGEEEMPILRQQNRKMASQITRMSAELETLGNTVAEQAQAVKEARELAMRADDAGYQRALRDLKTQQREAVRQGDEESYEQIEEQITALNEGRRAAAPARQPAPTPVAPAPAAAPQSQEPPAEAVAFVAVNPWFLLQPDLRTQMLAHHNAVMRESPTMPLADQLQEARARLAETHPEIGDEMAPRAPAPAPARRPAFPSSQRPTGGSSPPPRRSADPFDQIPADERAGCRKAFERSQRLDPDARADEYVAVYLDPHTDVIALRRSRK